MSNLQEPIIQSKESDMSILGYIVFGSITLFTKIIPGLCVFIIGASILIHLGLLFCDRILPLIFDNLHYLWTTPIKKYLPYMFSTENVMGPHTMWVKPFCFFVLLNLYIGTFNVYQKFENFNVGIFGGLILYIKLVFYGLIYFLLNVPQLFVVTSVLGTFIIAKLTGSSSDNYIPTAKLSYTSNYNRDNTFDYVEEKKRLDDLDQQQRQQRLQEQRAQVKETMQRNAEAKKQREIERSRIITAFQKTENTVAIQTQDGRIVYKQGILLGYTQNEVSIKNVKTNYIQFFDGRGKFLRSTIF